MGFGGNRWLVFLISFTLASCAVNLKMPTGRFDSPETMGIQGSKELSLLSVQGSQDFELTRDFYTTPVDTGNPIQSQSYLNYGAKGAVALSPSLDLSFKYLVDAQPMFQIKHQFLGEPLSEHVERQFSAALIFGLGYAEASPSRTVSGITITNSHVTEVLDVALSLGYRIDKSWLFYISPWFTFYHFKGERERTELLVPTLSEYSGSGRILGYSVGIEWLPIGRAVLRVEGSYTKAGVAQNSETGFFVGAQGGFFF